MKIKKFAVIMAIVPFGAATALTAAGTAPYYGNATFGTAPVNPYVSRLSLSLLHLYHAPVSLPFFPNIHQRLATKEPMSTLSSSLEISSYEAPLVTTPQTTTTHSAE